MFGAVSSDPTVSRLIDRLAEDEDRALAAIHAARAEARGLVWQVAGTPRQAGRVVLDLAATLVIAHSEKEKAAKTWKKTFGFHPLLGYVDHGPRVCPRVVKRAISKHRAKGQIDPTNHQAKIAITIITS